MNYQNKYLKYKKKYIELKSQMGGMLQGPMNNDNNNNTEILKDAEKKNDISRRKII